MSVKPAAVTKLTGDDEKVRGSKEQQNPSKMYIIGREICFFLAIFFTTYAAVLNSNHTNSKGPPPAPFFRKGSLVIDYYSGEFRTLLKRASQVELMFIMYYAPWDAESQSLRNEFEIAAEHHHKQVFFAAINCWQPGSECRSQASKIPIVTYPEFIAYPLQGSPIGYEGQRLAAHMIKFLNNLLHPIHRIEEADELKSLKIRYDAVVVGCVEFKNMRGGVEYRAFYEAALKLPDRSTRDIGFAIVTNPIAAARIGLKTIPSISLHLWNKVLEYSGSWKSEALSQWISQNINTVSSWISPPGVKSLTFKPFVDIGSVLMMFTPHNPLLSHTNTYDMLREVGLIYHDCKNNTYLQDFINFFRTERLKMNMKEEAVYSTCQRKKKNLVSSKKSFDIPVQIIENVWINTSSSGLKSRKRIQAVPSWSGSSTVTSWLRDAVSTCASVPKSDAPSFPKTSSQSSMLISGEDYRSAASLINWRFIEKCQQYFRAISFGGPSSFDQIDTTSSETIPEFDGLACKSNVTLSMLAMDSNVYEHFADGLGIDLNEYADKTAVLIFNAEQETVYVMDKPVTFKNLQEFILNYTKGQVERHFRSEPRSSLPPNRYQQDNVIRKNSCNKSASISLLELTSSTFLTVALNETQNVVVFYHSPYCAFCHGVSHVYLTVAHHFCNIKNLIFARIDGENNDLPWEFTVHHYPTILFLPAYRKSESRAFSQRLPLTVDNLSKFILANLNMETRLQGMIQLCSRWSSKQFLKKQTDCILDVRQTCLKMIAETLKKYRMISRLSMPAKYKQKKCQLLLRRLQYLKEIHLQLGASNITIASNLISEFHSKVSVNNEVFVNRESDNINYSVKDEL